MTISTKAEQPKISPKELDKLLGLDTIDVEKELREVGIIRYSSFYRNPPPQKPILIGDTKTGGILREGGKLLLAGVSKAGKSFGLIELALALASGKEWLGFPCKKTTVLYLNLEIEDAEFKNRVDHVAYRMGVSKEYSDNLCIWNLRGKEVPTTDTIIRMAKLINTGMVIIDPIYKLSDTNENDQQEVALLFKQIDTICQEAETACAIVHHYKKGAGRDYADAMDRASGSGVFARDPDAILAMSPLDIRDITPEQRQAAGVGLKARAFTIDFTLRSFVSPDPIKVWFDNRVHIVDNENLKDAKVQNNRTKNRRTNDEKKAEFIKSLQTAFTEHPELCNENGGIPISSLKGKVQSLQGEPIKTEKTIRDNTKKLNGKHFRVEKGIIYPVGNENGNGNGIL